MPALFAFLHHLAAFTLVAAVAVEFALTRGELTLGSARRLVAADAVLGASAGVLLLVGLLRVFVFEKGGGYYLHNGPFLVKLATVRGRRRAVGGPDPEFRSWRPALQSGEPPAPDAARLARVRTIVYWELAGVVVILACAAMMARGIGSFG